MKQKLLQPAAFILYLHFTTSLLFAADITWQGNVSNNWDTPGNWIGGVVPGASDRAFIPVVSGSQSYPVISSAAATVRYIEILNNAQLTVAAGGSITINGTGCGGGSCYGLYIRNNSTFTVAIGGAFIVQNTGSYGIYSNEGHFVNNGSVTVSTTTDRGIFTTTNGGTNTYNPSFTNTGILSLSNINSTGIYNHVESDTLLFNNSGSINLTNINASAMYNYTYRSNSRMVLTNNGNINIYLCANRGIVNECRPDVNSVTSYFVFDNYGNITVDSTGQHGIYNYNNKGTFYLYNRTGATITVKKTGNNANLYQRGLYNHNRQDDLSYNPYFEAHNWGTITIRQTNSQGLRNESMKHELNFTNHHIIRTSRTVDGGVTNYCNNTFSKINFFNVGSIYIDTVAVYGLYNTVALNQTADTTAILNFINDGLIRIDSTTSYGAYNNTDNGQLSFINNGNFVVRRAGNRGIFNRQNKSSGNYACAFQFSNFGTIDIDYAQQQGFYSYSNRHYMECNNFNHLLINHVNQSDGFRLTAENGGQVSFTNYGDVNIANINRQGIYVSTLTGGSVTFNNQTPLNISNCMINGIYLYGLNGTINFTNSSAINISNITADGIYNECISNSASYPALLNFTHSNTGTLNISNCSDEGWYVYSQNGTHTINLSGPVSISNVTDNGMYQNATTNGILTMNVNNTIDLNNCGTRGIYNLTDNGAVITFNNNALIDIENTGTAGLYNFSRDGTINFNNYQVINQTNSTGEAGFYNLNRQEEAPYPTTLNFNNTGQININGTLNHGLIFNNANGTINAQSAGSINIANTTQQGLYCYNRATIEAFPVLLNFTNTGFIRVENSNERGIYNYTYRGQPLTFTNNGTIDISKTRFRGINNFAENNNAVLNFVNNGSIAVDTIREEGIYNQVTQTSPSLLAQLHFTNNGQISIDSTKLDGLQNYGNRGNLTFTNSNTASLTISRTNEYGILNQNREDQAGYSTVMNFVNQGNIHLSQTLFAAFYNYNERGNALNVNNNGVINILQSQQYGLYNRSYNSTPTPPDYSYEITNLNFTNNGTINIDGTNFAGLYNYADAGDNVNFTNLGTLNVLNSNEQGIYNRSRKTGSFTPVATFRNNGGIVNISQTGLSSIYNYANNDSLFFYNNAPLNLQSSAAYGIYNFVENNTSVIHFNNQTNGNIHVQNTALSGIYNFTTRSASTQNNAFQFINNGQLTISNVAGRGIHNYDYRCNNFAFTNSASGNIHLHTLAQDALYNETMTNSSTYPMSQLVFNNQGSLLIENLTENAQALFNNNTNSLFQFTNSGQIEVLQVPKNGILNQSIYTSAANYSATAFTFTNPGNIRIDQTGEEGLRNTNYGGTFNFGTTGNIKVFNTQREGIENAGYADIFVFTNNGAIQLRQNTFDAFYNTNGSATPLQCTNQTCGFISTDGRFKNNAACVFTNNGLIETTFGFNHNNQGSFINNGLIEASSGFNTTPTALQNNALILPYLVLQPLSICNYQPVSPALNNPGNVYTVSGWFTSPSATQSAGNFNAATNTFTPAANLPFGQQTLYVQMSDNITGCNRLRPLEIDLMEWPAVNNPLSAEICSHDLPVELSVLNEGINYEYNWFNQPSGGIPVYTGTEFTPEVATNFPNIYTFYVEATHLAGGCTNPVRTPVSLTVLERPAIAVAVADTISIDEGQPIPELAVQNAGPDIEYIWYAQPVDGTPLATGLSYTPNPGAAFGTFTYYVETFSNLTGCPSRSRTPITLIIIDLPYTLFRAKVRLQGPYNAITGLMDTHLKNGNLVPPFQPFYTLPWEYPGSIEDVTFPENVPPDAVDWVMVEARSAANMNLIIEQRAVFLRNDGILTDIYGTEGVQFFYLNPNTAYYFIVRSRNHLDVMSSSPINVPNYTAYDFTQPSNVMGGIGQLAVLDGGLFALASGDINADGVISVADFNRYQQQSGMVNQYVEADLNMDKNVTIADFNFLQPNISKIGIPQVRY